MYHTKGNGLQQILGGNLAFCGAWIDNTGELSSHRKTYRSSYCSSFTRCMFSLPGWESKHAADWSIYFVTHNLLHNDEGFRVSVYMWKWLMMMPNGAVLQKRISWPKWRLLVITKIIFSVMVNPSVCTRSSIKIMNDKIYLLLLSIHEFTNLLL